MAGPDESVSDDDCRWLDSVAELLIASDDDRDAETSLLDRYRNDAGLHPAPTVTQASPHGDPPIDVHLPSTRPDDKGSMTTPDSSAD